MKIIIAGIGGVGGYFGGLLAHHFFNHEIVEVNFFARGQHLKEIQNHGLKVINGNSEWMAVPHLASDNPSQFGLADVVIVATKSYDLEPVIAALKPCINKDTIILPLLNGVDNKERIMHLLPDSTVLDGCVYLVSRLKQVGVIENSGNIQTLYFGRDNLADTRLILLQNLFKEAGIEAFYSDNISKIIWEKFIFISPTATATSFFDRCIGEIVSDFESLETTKALIEEVTQLARQKNIHVSDDIAEKTLQKLRALPFETTTSMHTDFKNSKPNTELQTLTGYVIKESEKHSIATPAYLRLFTALIRKSAR